MRAEAPLGSGVVMDSSLVSVYFVFSGRFLCEH
jgi:hypothetical protein